MKRNRKAGRMLTRTEFFRRVRQQYDSLSATHKKIADYISADIDEVIFMSVADIASKLDTSEAAVVRFAQALGYTGFPDLRKELVRYYRENTNPAKKVESYLNYLRDEPRLYARIVQREIEYLQSSVSAIREETFDRAVNAICGAEHRYVFASGAANVGLATYLSFRLNRFLLRTTPIRETGKNLFDSFILFRPNDIVINYSFYQPTSESIIIMNFVKKNRIPNLLITDTNIPPMIRDADMVLYARRGPFGVFHSLIVPMAITNALIIGVAQKLGSEALDALNDLSQIRKSYLHEAVAMTTEDFLQENSRE
jgi:DNA-binding MurR/RpiR family transcriptional regulator